VEYLNVANSVWMWIACIPAVAWVIFQSIIFLKRSVKDGKEMGITEETFKNARKSAIIASIGPCFVMFSGMVALMVNIGGPMAWLRLDFIGSSVYELMAANFAAEGMGVKLGSAAMNVDVLLNLSLVMPFGCLGWVIFSGLFSDKMEVVNNWMSGGKEILVPIMGGAGIMGAWASLTVDRVIPFGNGSVAAIVSAITMAILLIGNKKYKLQWVKDWAISIAMVVGVAGGILV